MFSQPPFRPQEGLWKKSYWLRLNRWRTKLARPSRADVCPRGSFATQCPIAITPIHGINCKGRKVSVEQTFLSADWRNFPVPLGRQECRPNPQTGKSALLIPIFIRGILPVQHRIRLWLTSRRISPPVIESKNALGSGTGRMKPGTTYRFADEMLKLLGKLLVNNW